MLLPIFLRTERTRCPSLLLSAGARCSGYGAASRIPALHGCRGCRVAWSVPGQGGAGRGEAFPCLVARTGDRSAEALGLSLCTEGIARGLAPLLDQGTVVQRGVLLLRKLLPSCWGGSSALLLAWMLHHDHVLCFF